MCQTVTRRSTRVRPGPCFGKVTVQGETSLDSRLIPNTLGTKAISFFFSFFLSLWTKEGVSKLGPAGQLHILINKVLLEHSHTHTSV